MVQKENFTGILRFFQKKSEVGSGTGSFFVGGTTGRSRVGTREGGNGTGRGDGSEGVQGFSGIVTSQVGCSPKSRTNLIEDDGQKETGTESVHAGSTAAAVAMQNLLRLLLEKDEFLNQYNHIEQLDLEISLPAQIREDKGRFQ